LWGKAFPLWPRIYDFQWLFKGGFSTASGYALDKPL